MAGTHTIAANDASFASEVLESKVPVLVDFWAEWCGPCRMIGPMLEEVAGELSGRAKVVKVNVDEARDLALKYQVTSIPMLLFFKGGQVADQVVGAGTPKAVLKAKLEALA